MASIDTRLAVLFLDMEGVLINESSPRSMEVLAGHISNIEASCPEYENLPGYSPEATSHLIAARAKARCLNPVALNNLSILIDNLSESMDVAIVITSLWRETLSAQELREHVFKDHFFHPYIIDKIPDRNATCIRMKRFSPQGKEQKTPSELCLEKYGFDLIHGKGRLIDYWLREHSSSLNIHSFVIIDQISGDAHASEIDARYPGRLVHITANKLFTIENAIHCFKILNDPFSKTFPDKDAVARGRSLDDLRLKQRLESIVSAFKQNSPTRSYPSPYTEESLKRGWSRTTDP